MKNKEKSPEHRLNGKLRQSEPYTEQRRLESEARTAEVLLRTAKARGELQSRKEQEDQLARQISAAKTKFMAVRRRIEALHPDLSKAVLNDIESMHREALEELSTGE